MGHETGSLLARGYGGGHACCEDGMLGVVSRGDVESDVGRIEPGCSDDNEPRLEHPEEAEVKLREADDVDMAERLGSEGRGYRAAGRREGLSRKRGSPHIFVHVWLPKAQALQALVATVARESSWAGSESFAVLQWNSPADGGLAGQGEGARHGVLEGGTQSGCGVNKACG